MTPDEATVFAYRIAAAIHERAGQPVYAPSQRRTFPADFRRVARDLAGFIRALDGLDNCDSWMGGRHDRVMAQHAVRYAEHSDAYLEALIDTGDLYGVTP